MKSGNKNENMEEMLRKGGWKTYVQDIKLPQQRKAALMGQVKASLEEKRRSPKSRAICRMRYVRIASAAACLLLLLTTVSMTAYAVYVSRHLNVFFEADVTMEQMQDIEKELEQLEGVVSCRYIDADTAWKEFGKSYLTPEMMESYQENPLAESANFKVGISLDADAEQMKERIGELPGVRYVSGVWE